MNNAPGNRPIRRVLAIGGLVGPAAFVGAWATAGLRTRGYSPVSDAISDLAAIGAATRALMTTGFVVDGIGLTTFGLALRSTVDGPAWIAAVITGVATLGVAAAPLGGGFGDGAHAAMAGLAYVSISAAPLLAAGPLRRSGRPGWSRASVATSAIAAGALVATTAGPAHGFWQRLGLTVGDAWIVGIATLVLLGRLPATGARA